MWPDRLGSVCVCVCVCMRARARVHVDCHMNRKSIYDWCVADPHAVKAYTLESHLLQRLSCLELLLCFHLPPSTPRL